MTTAFPAAVHGAPLDNHPDGKHGHGHMGERMGADPAIWQTVEP
jgi:hypothetical protein